MGSSISRTMSLELVNSLSAVVIRTYVAIRTTEETALRYLDSESA